MLPYLSKKKYFQILPFFRGEINVSPMVTALIQLKKPDFVRVISPYLVILLAFFLIQKIKKNK